MGWGGNRQDKDRKKERDTGRVTQIKAETATMETVRGGRKRGMDERVELEGDGNRLEEERQRERGMGRRKSKLGGGGGLGMNTGRYS